MNMRKWLCLVVAMLLALSAAAMAETANAADLQAQLDAANARIAELEAEVEKYRPVYDSQVVAEYGENGVIWLADAQEQYDLTASQAAQYGMSIDSIADRVKQSILDSLVQRAVLDDKTAELGLSELSDEVREDLAAKAAEDLETYIGYYKSYFVQDESVPEDEARETTIAGLAENGITEETFLENRIHDYVDEQLHDYVTHDVVVTEEDIRAEYDKMVSDDQENYSEDDFSYTSALSDGAVVAWNPEGYRTVKHVLVKFDDSQSSQYNDLESTLSSLQDELAALDEAEAKVEAGEDAEEAGEEAAEEAEEEETPRSREEIEADIENVNVALEALYAELEPKAQEVIDAFNGGASIEELIAQYGEDPGMTQEPTASQGYAVAATSTSYDPAFTEGAMSIAEPGQISGMVRGSYGIHIIYYLGDITPGAVPFEDIRDGVEAQALEDKVQKTYDDQVAAWVEEANVVYHLDRF